MQAGDYGLEMKNAVKSVMVTGWAKLKLKQENNVKRNAFHSTLKQIFFYN
jgi:hypothetical protein